MTIHQHAEENRQSSFWYDGIVAVHKGHRLYAHGEVEIFCNEHGDLCYDNKPRNCCCFNPKNDKDMDSMNDKVTYEMFSWFEVIDPDGETFGDCMGSYDEGMAQLLLIDNFMPPDLKPVNADNHADPDCACSWCQDHPVCASRNGEACDCKDE